MKLEKVEAKIGICFQDRSLLRLALTHCSYAQNTGEPNNHNERLEFLGDAILEVIVVDYLYYHFCYLEVGKLAPLCNKLVSNKMLLKFANKVALREFILLGKGEEFSQVRQKSHRPFATAFEALIGAIYLDRGFADVREWLVQQFINPALQSKLKNINTRKQPQEQLEFLGNAILKAIAAHYLYLNFPAQNERYLTLLREKLICKLNLIHFEHQVRPEEFIYPATTLKELVGVIYLYQSFSNTYTWFVNRFISQYKNG